MNEDKRVRLTMKGRIYFLKMFIKEGNVKRVLISIYSIIKYGILKISK